MVIDLVLLGLVGLFALVGAATGAARQVAYLIALGVAAFAARPLGLWLAPRLAAHLDGPLVLSRVAATLLVFFTVLVAVRYALGALLGRLAERPGGGRRVGDRALGALLGGLKVALLAYVVLSALVYVEQNVVVAGQRLGLSPRDSHAVALARRHNLFERTLFAPLDDLVRVGRAARDPEAAARLRRDPAFQALQKDPRFQKALSDARLREALERGDAQALLRSDLVLELLQDERLVARLGAAARAAER